MAKKKRLTNREKKLYVEAKKELQAKGEHEYKVADQYNYIKDILDA